VAALGEALWSAVGGRRAPRRVSSWTGAGGVGCGTSSVVGLADVGASLEKGMLSVPASLACCSSGFPGPQRLHGVGPLSWATYGVDHPRRAISNPGCRRGPLVLR